MSKDITLVVMAAGMGSRFGGLKQIEPIGKNGEVLLDFSVYDAVKAGFTKVVFVIKHAIEEDFKAMVGKRIAKRVKVEYVFQETDVLPEGYVCPADRTKPWGTAHAILCCKDVVKEPFAVVNADDYYGHSAFVKMAEFLKNDSSDYCMVGFRLVNTLTENGYVSRGVCETENGILKSVTERTKISDCKYTEDDGETWIELSPDTVVSMNLWGFRPDIFDYISKGFKNFLDAKINDLAGTAMKSVSVNVGINDAENAETGSTYKNYSFSFKKRFLNDRLTIVIGGEVNSGDHPTTNDSFINNVSLEWKISDSENRYLRLFYDKNYESLLEGEIIETGIGYVYKKKLQNLRELFIFRKNDKRASIPETGNKKNGDKRTKGDMK